MSCTSAPTCSHPVLRPYQQETIEKVLERVRAGRRAPLVVLPTGGGKTVLIDAFVRRHLDRDLTHRVLVIAHRRELINQISRRIRTSGVGVAEICPGGCSDVSARVFVASTQTLLTRDAMPEGITLVVFDEAHHYSADEWSSLTTAYPDAHRLGFTATPARSDGRGLAPAFDSIVVGATIKELIAIGFLVPVRVIAPDDPLRHRQLVQRPVDAYREHASGKRAIVFAEFVADALAFRDEFTLVGIAAVVVHGEMSIADRDAAIRAHTEDAAVLINVMCLTEGFDSPQTEVIILARGCGSLSMYLQIVGRALRPFAGKSQALLIDLTGRAFYTHGAPDEDHEYSLVGSGIRTKGRHAGSTCFVCGCLVDGWPCGVCGYKPEGIAIDPIRVLGGTLAERFAKKRDEDEAVRIESLARWMAEARARGWKSWSALRKYQHVYGVPPSSSIAEAARLGSYSLACSDCTSCGRATVRTYRGGRCGKCAFEEKGAA